MTFIVYSFIVVSMCCSVLDLWGFFPFSPSPPCRAEGLQERKLLALLHLKSNAAALASGAGNLRGRVQTAGCPVLKSPLLQSLHSVRREERKKASNFIRPSLCCLTLTLTPPTRTLVLAKRRDWRGISREQVPLPYKRAACPSWGH